MSSIPSSSKRLTGRAAWPLRRASTRNLPQEGKLPQLSTSARRWTWLQEPDAWSDEVKAPRNLELLSLKIPDAPYSDERFKKVEITVDVAHAVLTAIEIFEVPLAGLLGLGVPVAGALLAAAAPFLAIGSGYAEATTIVARREMRTGFSRGVVCGASRRRWSDVKDWFWQYSPTPNPFNPPAAIAGQKANNTGLAAGFLQGQELAKNANKHSFFWTSLKKRLTAGDIAQYAGKRDSWQRRDYIDMYITYAVLFEKLYLRDD
jgi:hypothetical protein